MTSYLQSLLGMGIEALVEADVVSLFDRRQDLTSKLFNNIVNDHGQKLYELLSSRNLLNYNLWKEGVFKGFNSRTNRYTDNVV